MFTHTKGKGKNFEDYDDSEKNEFQFPTGIRHRENDSRNYFQKDRDKLIHSSAFRRLQGKTQVFGSGSGDFFRTRLTHSLEAAQIAKGIAQNHGVANLDLVELACLSHDIGHPPFGHSGEQQLHKLMENEGGFEGNAQNLRILNYLETKYFETECHGLNFTRASIDAILKYDQKYSDAKKSGKNHLKFYYDEDENMVKWAKENTPNEKNSRSIECQIMNWSDDIAYSTHDLEDGIKSGMISSTKIDSIKDAVKNELTVKEFGWDEKTWSEVSDIVKTLSTVEGNFHNKKAERTEKIANLISEFIKKTDVKERADYGKFPSRYRFNLIIDKKIILKCEMLKQLVWKMILDDQRVATIEKKGQFIIKQIFTQLTNDELNNDASRLLPNDFRERLDVSNQKRNRIVCDYIAGMTDNYALRLYSRLMESDIHSVFELL